MSQLLTSAQMNGIEQSAIASGTVDGATLMERAGAAAAALLQRRWPGMGQAGGGGPVVLLCGPGNNGGDGYVIARILRAAGAAVELLDLPGRSSRPAEAEAARRRWLAAGGTCRALTPDALSEAAALNPGLWVDALFGTGLRRPLAGDLAEVIRRLGQAGGAKLAVDMPSGLCADSGRVLGSAAAADLTITFQWAKRGHYLDAGPALCGALTVVDIGLGGQPLPEALSLLFSGGPPGAVPLKGGGHKYDYGHVLVAAGGVGRGGAARMAARAALRAGAGLVTLAPPPAAVIENAMRLDAVMLRPVSGAGDLDLILGDARVSVLCLGPGLGTDRAAELLLPALERPERGLVCDADALTALAADPALRGRLHDHCLLTPHDGEFRRLFPDIAERLAADPEVGAEVRPAAGPAYSRVDAAQEAARRSGCTVLLKGPDTVIAAPDGRVMLHGAVYERGVPWLATAGAGDVLAGIAAGLMAQGFAPFAAAGWAAWLHAEAAIAFGPGLIAEDLPDMLPGVLRNL